ncbi:hypothetical protein CKA32_004433 [Geitlerinema sp. FC II]|nr:hypothetical protein [Geitlerinema sp. CS-897]PPT11317.1 hypothetical protein CKA32_004433 [Geitlerinema sp. FC II]
MKLFRMLGLLTMATLVVPGAAIAGFSNRVEMVAAARGNDRENTIQLARNRTVTGTVERVWEDGFRLEAGDRNYRVDSWAVCGDNTASHLAPGDRVTVTGELEFREFDAYSIVKDDGTSEGLVVCR